MDSLTHVVLGACIGELFTDKQFGKKAMIWGALTQSIPDIDFIAGFWLSPTADLIAHRSFTHSILFALLVAFFLGIAAERFHRPHNISLKKWMFFIGTELFVHLLLDGFNNYGIGWFEPFTDKRFTFNAIYVADPLFSLPAIVGCIALIALHSTHHKRVIWARTSIIMTSFYLFYALFNKYEVSKPLPEFAKKQNIQYDRFFTTPAPFNTWLWFVVYEKKDGFYTGYRSVFDTIGYIDLQWHARNEYLLKPVADHKEVFDLKKFSQGYYTVEQKKDTLIFNDLRFGQVVGWHDAKQSFVFHYYLSHPEDNKIVVQRGRFALWNKETMLSFFRRIKGI
jgi:inner membrane protein